MIRRFAALVLATASSWANDTFVHESAGNLMFVSNHQGCHSDQGDYAYPREFFTEYALRTGALWAGPIRD